MIGDPHWLRALFGTNPSSATPDGLVRIHCHSPVNVNDMAGCIQSRPGQDKPRASHESGQAVSLSPDDPVLVAKLRSACDLSEKNRRLKARWTECCAPRPKAMNSKSWPHLTSKKMEFPRVHDKTANTMDLLYLSRPWEPWMSVLIFCPSSVSLHWPIQSPIYLHIFHPHHHALLAGSH